ncbi:ATP-binding protein [Nonomuraea spiralis]|uniref:ATP-binding protein n=1 Tax=Nonomuraea spiralis TaxID=46182 RepID=UPI0037BCF34E
MSTSDCEIRGSEDLRRHASSAAPSIRRTRTLRVRTRVVTSGDCGSRTERRRAWVFPPVVASVPAVRHSVGAQARRWGFGDTATAELLVTEVVANAVAQTTEPVHVRMSQDDGVLRLEVEEHGSTAPLPAARLSGPEEESGRGLFLLEALSEGWGVNRTETGKVVWFAVARETAIARAHAGRCGPV